MKNLLILTLFSAAAFAKTELKLERTTSADSLQAKLVAILGDYAEQDKKSKTPTMYY